jgi:hypothetical protein
LDTSIFEQIASSLTVKSICSPLGPDVPAGITMEELGGHVNSDPHFHPWDNPSRVIDAHGRILGMLSYEDCMLTGEEVEVEEFVVEDIMNRVEPHQILSCETTILDAVDLFGTKPNARYYVNRGNELIGYLEYTDLFAPLGRLAFLALALEIEAQALRLCQLASIRESCWLSISEQRKLKATQLFTKRFGREPKLEHEPTDWSPDIVNLIQCTQLADKATMIWKQKLINSATRVEVLGCFKQLRLIRDYCAHPGGNGPPSEFSKEMLHQFINSAKRMRSSFGESIQTHGADSTGIPLL